MTLPPPPKPLPVDAIVGGLAFHRLAFARRRRGWWAPLVTGLLGAAFYLVLTIVLGVAIGISAFVDPTMSGRFLSLVDGGQVRFDLTDPVLVGVLLLSIVLLLPSYVLASLIVQGGKLGFISSAAGRLRWGWLVLTTGAAVVVAVVLSGLSFLLPGGAEGVTDGSGVVAPADNPALWTTLLVLLVLVPLQAAAEEYVFRGYLMQAVGRWLRHPAFAILLPVPLFVLGHLYDPLGQLSVGIFAVAAGWLTWRTGGLEAAIALHVVNNLLAFLLGLAGLSDVNASSPGWISLVFSTLLIGSYVAVVEWLFRRSGLGRTVIVTPAPVPPVPPVPPVTTWHGAPMPQSAMNQVGGHLVPVYQPPVAPAAPPAEADQAAESPSASRIV